jgi:hypothetical protein
MSACDRAIAVTQNTDRRSIGCNLWDDAPFSMGSWDVAATQGGRAESGMRLGDLPRMALRPPRSVPAQKLASVVLPLRATAGPAGKNHDRSRDRADRAFQFPFVFC